MYIPHSKSVLLERLLDYIHVDIIRSKRELHQREKGLIHRLQTAGLQEHSFY